MSTPQTKIPFNKKKWREKTYSKKFKVQQWEEKRKKAVRRQYLKELKKCKAETGSNIAPSFAASSGESSKKNVKLSAYQLAKLEFERKKETKQERQEEFERRKAEREEALMKYKQKKMERYKKLSKKTKKGQPVMKERLELLLEKIQSECGTPK